MGTFRGNVPYPVLNAVDVTADGYPARPSHWSCIPREDVRGLKIVVRFTLSRFHRVVVRVVLLRFHRVVDSCPREIALGSLMRSAGPAARFDRCTHCSSSL